MRYQNGERTISADASLSVGRAPLWQQLWLWVVIAMVLGVVLGAWDPALAVLMEPFGNGFIKLITMLIGPLVFCTIINGMTRMANMTRIGYVTLKTLLIFEAMTLASALLAMASVDLLQPGKGMHIAGVALQGNVVQSYIAQSGKMKIVSFIINIIPNSFVGAFVNGNILQVLFIAVLCGVAIIGLGPKAEPVTKLLEAMLKVIYGVVRIVMWAAPVGAFGAIAFGIGKFGVVSIIPLSKFIGEFYVTCLIIIFALSLPVAFFCGFNFLKFLRYFRDEIALVIATTSSEVVLPRIIDKLERLGCSGGIAGLVVPAGYSFNPTGTSPYLVMVILFLAQAMNIPISLGQQIELLLIINLTARSAIGIAGSAFVVLIGTMGMWGLVPVASTALILGIHRLLSQAFVPTFAFTNAVAALGVAKWEKELDIPKLRRVLDMKGGG